MPVPLDPPETSLMAMALSVLAPFVTVQVFAAPVARLMPPLNPNPLGPSNQEAYEPAVALPPGEMTCIITSLVPLIVTVIPATFVPAGLAGVPHASKATLDALNEYSEKAAVPPVELVRVTVTVVAAAVVAKVYATSVY